MKSSEIRKPKGRSFLDVLYYSIPRAAIGFRADGEKIYAVALDWDEDATSKLDEQISEMISAPLESVDDLGEIKAYCQMFSETTPYNPELQADLPKMKPLQHAQIGQKTHGVKWQDYIKVHSFLDSNKTACAHFKHRFLLYVSR